MYVTVERVTIARFVTLPYGKHQFRGINCSPDVCGEPFKYFRFKVGQLCFVISK